MTRAGHGSTPPGDSTTTRSPVSQIFSTRILAPKRLTFSVTAASASHSRSRLLIRKGTLTAKRFSTRPVSSFIFLLHFRLLCRTQSPSRLYIRILRCPYTEPVGRQTQYAFTLKFATWYQDI